jgi:hypothetical protein
MVSAFVSGKGTPFLRRGMARVLQLFKFNGALLEVY